MQTGRIGLFDKDENSNKLSKLCGGVIFFYSFS
jgi:hypothetical protein